MRQDGSRFRLVATDMDGTLLGPDGAVSERTERVLRQARAQGLIVVLVTGRPPRWVRGVIDDGTVHELIICSNGALVYDPAADVIVKEHPIGPAVLARIIEHVAAALPNAGFAVERAGADTLMHTANYGPRHNRGVVEVPMPELVSDRVVKLLIRDRSVPLDDLLILVDQVAGTDAQATHSGYDLVEISGAGVTKGATLRELCDDLGVKAREVIAFGDMPNDLAMLTWAGHGVAVGNAHPAILGAADEIAPPNGDDGVARVVERVLAQLGG